VQAPIRYTFYAYRWTLPATASTGTPTLTPAAQEGAADSMPPQ
jgi:hypothetical protein